ncbi:hypothetical protein P7K49_011891, partial [Saguinus oedipus]
PETCLERRAKAGCGKFESVENTDTISVPGNPEHEGAGQNSRRTESPCNSTMMEHKATVPSVPKTRGMGKALGKGDRQGRERCCPGGRVDVPRTWSTGRILTPSVHTCPQTASRLPAPCGCAVLAWAPTPFPRPGHLPSALHTAISSKPPKTSGSGPVASIAGFQA